MDTIELELISDEDWLICPLTLSQAERLVQHVQRKLSDSLDLIDLTLYGESKKTSKKDWLIHHLTRDQAEGTLDFLQRALSSPVSRLDKVHEGLRVFGD